MEEKPSTARLALKWGLISGVVFMIYTTAINVTNQFTNSSLTWLSLVIAIVITVMALREYRTLNGGYMTYGEGVGLGTLVSVVSGLISSTFNMIYNTFIDPTLPERIKDYSRVQLEERGMSDEQIDQAMEITQSIQSPGLQFFMGVLLAGIFGLIVSLIVSAFLRRNKPFAEFE